MQVELSMKDGGFVRYEPKNPRYVNREMKQAPEDGYHETLTLAGEYAKRMPALAPDSKGEFFFFRHKTFYGRGIVTWADVDRGGQKVLVKVRLFIQPDGSRNLETPE